MFRFQAPYHVPGPDPQSNQPNLEALSADGDRLGRGGWGCTWMEPQGLSTELGVRELDAREA